MRVRAAVGLVLVVVTSLLVGCDDASDETKPGDVIRARADDQFKDGQEATVVIPTGRLLIHAGEPVGSASADETRTRETVDAPAGAVLVPITWQYDTWASKRLDPIVATSDTPTVDLVSDDEHYRLPPPERDNEAGESFYVVVDGDAEDPTLEIDFDGVTQSVDLADGSTDEGEAAPLYDIGDERLKKKPCDEEDWFKTRVVNARFVCDLIGPVLTPYAAGEWAPEGSLWLAVTLTTELGVYAETDLFGSGARYAGRRVKMRVEIDGEGPVYRLSTGDDADQCPSPPSINCGSSAHLIFEVPADDAEQGPLVVKLTYQLKTLNSWGTWDGPERPTVSAEEKFKLWEPKKEKKKGKKGKKDRDED